MQTISNALNPNFLFVLDFYDKLFAWWEHVKLFVLGKPSPFRYIPDREKRLTAINEFLARQSLKPMGKLGDASKGEREILRIKGVRAGMGEFFKEIVFEVTSPDGNTYSHSIHFNANSIVNDGALILLTVNGQVAYLKQWRTASSRWTYEFFRGFPKVKKGIEATEENLITWILEGKIPDTLLDPSVKKSIVYLGRVDQDTGRANVSSPAYRVNLEVSPQIARDLDRTQLPSGTTFYLTSAEDAQKMIGGKIKDNHSLATWLIANKQ